MDFGFALYMMKQGKRVTRRKWKGELIDVFYCAGDSQGIPCSKEIAEALGIQEGETLLFEPHFLGSTIDGRCVRWSPSDCDCLAEDWEISNLEPYQEEKNDMCKEIGKRKAMISQPMAEMEEAEIIATREKAIKSLEERGFEVVNTLFTDEWYDKENMEKRGVVQIPLCFLAKSLENMSLCHAVYFCKGWKYARGCRLEHEAAKAYGLQIMYEPNI